MKNILFFLFVIAVFITSCTDGNFEQVVDIDLPEHEPALAVSSSYAQQDASFRVYVTLSQGILVDDASSPLESAIVLLKQGENLISSLNYNAQLRTYESHLGAGVLEVGKNYQLEVTHPDYSTASAIQTLPTKPSLIELEYEPEGGVDAEGYKVDEFVLKMKDEDPDDNYYYFDLNYVTKFWNGTDTTYYTDPAYYMGTHDALAVMGYVMGRYYDDVLLLSDEAFNLGEYEFRFFSDPRFLGPDQSILLNVYSITKAQYQFMQSLRAYDLSRDNPFAEPVTVVDNIENGYGIFTLSNRASIEP